MGWFANLGRDKPWAQGCIIAAAGIVLGVSGCIGFLATTNFHSGNASAGAEILNVAAALVFVGGLLAALVGGVWWLVGLFRRARKAAPPPAPPATSGPAGETEPARGPDTPGGPGTET